jgi:hypothetical protein
MSGVTKTLFGGSDSKQKSKSGLDPRFADAYFDNYARAQDAANNLAYGDDFYAGADLIRNAVGSGYGFNSLNTAADALKQGLTFQAPTVSAGGAAPAMMISGSGVSAGQAAKARDVMSDPIVAAAMARGDVRDIAGGSFLDMNLDAYMNPYLRNVADTTMSDLDRARQMQLMQDQYSASRAGAFGGSRHGIAEAETGRNYFDRLGSTLGSLYATGFNAATGLAGADLTRAFEAASANQSADYNVGSLNAQLANAAAIESAQNALNAQLGNQSADVAINTANLDAQTRAAIASAQNALEAQLGNQSASTQLALGSLSAQTQAAIANAQAQLDAQGLSLDAARLLSGLGTTQLDAALTAGGALQNLGLADINLALQQQGLLNEALGLNPGGGSGMTNTSSGSSSSQNGIFKSIGLG